MKQIDKVLEAYYLGSRTASEVSVLTGIPLRQCAAYSCTLTKKGLLRDKGPINVDPIDSLNGPKPHFYEPTKHC